MMDCRVVDAGLCLPSASKRLLCTALPRPKHHDPLLPDIRKQIIASAPKPSCRLALTRTSMLRRTRVCRSGRRSTAPAPKVIVLCDVRCTPTRVRRLRMGCSRRSCRLTRCRRSPHIVAAPGIHVREASVVHGRWGGRCLRCRGCCRGRQVESRVRGRRGHWWR
jgi:hypothetical protein